MPRQREPERERMIVFALGAQGSGKTTLLKSVIAGAKARGERVAGLETNGKLPGFSLAVDEEAWLAKRLPKIDPATRKVIPVEARYRAELLVFDDADRYIPKSPTKDSPWRQLALTNRHADVDVFVTGRRLQAFPDELISGVDYLYLFQLSRADVNAAKRLALVQDAAQVPTEKYEFVRLEPKSATGNPVKGRTLPGGGIELDE